MAMRILIATVGGSCAPVVCAIRQYEPDLTIFICSSGPKPQGTTSLIDGPGNVCGDERRCKSCGALLGDPHGACIVTQTGLTADCYLKFETDDPDDMSSCFTAVTRAFDEALRRDADAMITADYTGGTKTMSAALMRAATGLYATHATLSIVTGQRDNLRAVQDGTEHAWRQEATQVVLEEQWHVALTLANSYHYASAGAVLDGIARHSRPVPPALRHKTQTLMDVCAGLNAWDRFDHIGALTKLQVHPHIVGALLANLKYLAKAAQKEQGKGVSQANEDESVAKTSATASWDMTRVLPVYDLMRNAERRAAQGRHDDAVARLYRALEMLAQALLRDAHDLDTSNVDRAKVPESWLTENGYGNGVTQRPGTEASRLQIGLRQSYSLLLALDDAVGRTFGEHEQRLSEMLMRRNQSILAHGTRGISAGEYPALHQAASDFIQQAVAASGLLVRMPDQFPSLSVNQF